MRHFDVTYQNMTILLEKLDPLISAKDHIVWDFNGTILNDTDHTVNVVNTLLTEHNLPNITTDQYRQVFKFPVIDYYVDLGFDFNKESFQSLCDKYIERFMSGFRDGSQLVPGITGTLQGIQALGKKQSILSAAEQTGLHEVVKHLGIQDYFDFIFGIETHYADSKIHRGHDLLKSSNVDAKKTVIIGDTIHDLEVGRAIGIDVILVAYGHQSAERLKKHHNVVLEL